MMNRMPTINTRNKFGSRYWSPLLLPHQPPADAAGTWCVWECPAPVSAALSSSAASGFHPAAAWPSAGSAGSSCEPCPGSFSQRRCSSRVAAGTLHCPCWCSSCLLGPAKLAGGRRRNPGGQKRKLKLWGSRMRVVFNDFFQKMCRNDFFIYYPQMKKLSHTHEDTPAECWRCFGGLCSPHSRSCWDRKTCTACKTVPSSAQTFCHHCPLSPVPETGCMPCPYESADWLVCSGSGCGCEPDPGMRLPTPG